MATYSDIARAFISGLRVPAPSKTINGLKRLYADGDTLYSYGPHFPALIKEQQVYAIAPLYWLNESKYYPSEYERDSAGFRQGYYSTRDRSKMPSPTTRRQLDDIASELKRAGWQPTSETLVMHGYTYRQWTKDGATEATEPVFVPTQFTEQPYLVRGFDMGEDPDETPFDEYNAASDYYESIHYDTKQLLHHGKLMDQHVYGRRSFNINQ